MPFLIFLVTKWGGNALIYGIIGATYSFFQFIGAPILGKWSDKYGRRKILLLSQGGTLVSWLLLLTAFLVPQTIWTNIDSSLLGKFSVTLPLIILFVARAADGLTGGNISVANAYLVDISDESDRNEKFGKMAVSGNLGFVIGPALAGLLGATVYGEIVPVIAAIVISFIATLIVLFFLPESKKCIIKSEPDSHRFSKVFGQDQKDCYQIEQNESTDRSALFKIKGIPVLLAMYFLVMLGFNFFYVVFPVYAMSVLSWSVTNTGVFFAFLSIMMVLVQGPLLKFLSSNVSDKYLMLIGSLILSISFLFFNTTDTKFIYIGATLLAIGNGLMWPSLLSILSKAAGDKVQGAVQGFAGSAGAIASIIGLILGGFLYSSLGANIFLIAGAIIFVVFLSSFHLLRN